MDGYELLFKKTSIKLRELFIIQHRKNIFHQVIIVSLHFWVYAPVNGNKSCENLV